MFIIKSMANRTQNVNLSRPFVGNNVHMSLLADRMKECKDAWEARTGSKLVKTDLARFTGASKQAVGDWFVSRTAQIKCGYLFKAAEFFQVNPVWLCSGDGQKDQVVIGGVHQDAAKFAINGIRILLTDKGCRQASDTQLTEIFEKLYQAWFDEDTRKLGIEPLLKLVY